MTSTTDKIVSEALVEANSEAQDLIPSMKTYGTEPFVSFAGVGGRKYSISFRFPYDDQPEIKQLLEQIAKRCLNRSIRRNSGLAVLDEIEKSLRGTNAISAENI